MIFEVFMELGSKIKRLRQRANLTQEELADRCELTKGYISQLENDNTSPSIATLEDIVKALGISLADLFSETQRENIVFKAENCNVKNYDGYSTTWLISNSTINEMEPILVNLPPHSKTDEDVPHEGEEFGYVLTGTIVVVVGKNSYYCKKGDSFYFKAEKTHYLKNNTNKEAKVLWVSSPPNF